MEALHEIPDFLANWDRYDVEELRLHLRGFDHTRWIGSPNLVQIFDDQLRELSK